MSFKVAPETIQNISSIARRIYDSGGRAFFVGGFVRDSLLGRKPKDIDIEVYGLSMETLQKILAESGKIILVGRQFGVLRVAGLDVDWSVPRQDSAGRHPRVAADPSMTPAEASRRRDLTMNSMLQDVLTGEILDPWSGQRDMEQGVLRTPDSGLFVEDPLRFYRVMQFAARFEMQPGPELNEVCQRMDIAKVSVERIEEEFNKLLLEADRPSLGLRWLNELGRLPEVLPELAPLKDTPQDPEWHPEGNVWRHTLQVVDAAAALRSGDKQRDLILMWAALCHDIGKPVTTAMREGHIRSMEHDREGEKLTKALLKRLVKTSLIVKGVSKLVAEHMKVLQFYQNKSTEKGFKRLALKLAPEADLELLAALALADSRGINTEGDLPLNVESEMVDWFLKTARESQVSKEPEKPVLLGRHLIGIIEPGPEMGKILKKAYRIQIDEGVRDVEVLKRKVIGEG
ncbi:MAG TPA: HD domain-containing protein [archaeon]|nr:HD domain-containing protein [archaeon]